jgi:microcin C transport system permease protein
MIFNDYKNPIARKRFLRFKEMKRAYLSLWILAILYLISLSSELICNNTPLYVRFNEKSYYPLFKYYSEDIFTGNNKTKPDYKKLNNLSFFKENPDNFMIFPPFPYGPFESIDPESIAVSDNVIIDLTPLPKIGTVNIRKDYSIERSDSFGLFISRKEREVKDLVITEYFIIPRELKLAVEKRFANNKAPRITHITKSYDGMEVEVSLSTFSSRKKPPQSVRLLLREVTQKDQKALKLVFNRKLELIQNNLISNGYEIWKELSVLDKELLLKLVKTRFLNPVDPITLTIRNQIYHIDVNKEDVRFPFAPSEGHILGIDGAGRDVFARILYGMRTSITFGLMLVVSSMAIGIISGSIQGYYGGAVDITCQRLIEIWSALPFLYIMILMGSIYGRSFTLLLFCYGLFNWIGISYYIRAEFLRLRKQTFVEAAVCTGISSHKVIFKHILPNAMVPVITFFPFSLVGAIGALTALDYLGFGLPPPTPSWGELLFQAQQYRWAWWLILYPSLFLFIVMLLGVFIGEGIRNAYDPKKFTRLE